MASFGDIAMPGLAVAPDWDCAAGDAFAGCPVPCKSTTSCSFAKISNDKRL